MTTTLDPEIVSHTSDPALPASGDVAREFGLLSNEQMLATLRALLGDAVPEERLQAAVSALRAAEADQWEQLPPGIDPDMGFNYFVVCRETCWLAREITLFGTVFRIFRQRD